MSVSYLRSLTSRMTLSEDSNPNHRVRTIHGQTDLSYSDHTLADTKLDVPNSTKETNAQNLAEPQVKSQTSSDTNTTNLNDNLQRLRKRIKKLSRRVIEAEKKSLIKLYDKPTKVSPGVHVSAPAHLRIGFDGDQKKSGVDGTVTDAAKLKGKKRKKRKKVVEKASSSTTVQSDESNECTRIRKSDILQLIQQKEQLIHAGDESDVDTDSPNPTKVKTDKSKFQAVSGTVNKLVNVNDHVQQVLCQSLSQKSSIASNVSGISAMGRPIKPVSKILTAGSAHFVTCVRSMSNTTPNEPEVKIPVTVPEYLKRAKTSPIQLPPRTPITIKRKAKRTPKDADAKLGNAKEMKSDESSMPTSKSALKKSTTRKKPKKDRVVFNEPPEIIGQIEKTIVLKSECELLKDMKPKKKRSKRKDSPASAPSRGDSTDAEKKKTKTKLKKTKKTSDAEETPQSNPNLIDDKPCNKLVPVCEDSICEKQQEQPELDSKEICRKMRKNTTHTLSNLNVQMSNTLKESIAHLNDICMRVRTTLSDMEKEQVKYNKKRRCPEMSSEAGSIVEMEAVASVTSNDQNKTLYQITDMHSEPAASIPREYTVVKQLDNEGAIDHILTSISMCGDDFPTAPTDKEARRHRKKAKKAKRLKEQEAKDALKEASPPLERQEVQERPQSYRIPIWERKPPSVINDIQMIVRRQATRSQYKEFMKTLKRETRKIKPSTIILPQESKVCLDPAWPGQVRVKPDTKLYKFAAYQKIKEIRETLAENSKNKKKCAQCSSEKCTCGITVENVHPATSAQKMQWIKTRSAMARRGIQAFDILDEITLKDLEPLQSEYPRKDHITNDDAISKVEDTLLYRLLYNESPEVLETLLRGASEDSNIKQGTSPQKIEMTTSPSTMTKRDEVLRPLNLVSKAYQMYEKLELGSDPPATPPGTVRSKIIPAKPLPERLKSPDAKTRKAMQTCPKQFNDAPNIPTDLYNNLNDDTKKKALRKPSGKFCNVKLRTDPEINLLKKRKKEDKKASKSSLAASTSSLSAAKKHTKQKKREYMKPKIKPYLIDPNMNLKNILTVMRVSIHPKSFPTLGGIIGRDKRFPRVGSGTTGSDLMISEENRAKIAAMSKRDIIRTLKPYIFMDIKPPMLTVMPVQAKYNLYQAGPTRPPQDHHPVATASRVRTTESQNRRAQNTPSKKTVYCKDHGDNSLSPLRKYCKRCLQIQHDAAERLPTVRRGHSEMSSSSKKGSQKPQSRPISPKVSSRRSPSKVLSEEITNNAILTRNKLNEVKTLVNNNQSYFPKDLNRAIEDIEYKIVDVLANPTRHYGDAFVEIEDEIKSILSTMGGTAGKIATVNKKAKLKTKGLRSNTNTNFEDGPSSPLQCSSRLSINEKLVVPELRFDSCEESFGDVIQRNIAEKPLEEEKKKPLPAVGDATKYSVSFTMDLDKAIEGLDAIMSIEPSDISDDKQSTTVSLIQSSRKPSTIGNSKVSLCSDPPNDCTKLVNNFCEQVDRVVQKLVRSEDTQTDASQASQETASDDQKDVDEMTHRSDEYLTPYMRAVKKYRNSATSQSFVDFLDVLSNMPASERPVTADASSETAPAIMDSPASMADDLSLETCIYDDAEFANMVDECLMCDDLMNVPSTESYYRERDFRPIADCAVQLSTLSTNIPVEVMNSPRSMFSSKEIFDTTVNTICQTMSTNEEFNEVEDYVKQYYRNTTVDSTEEIDQIVEQTFVEQTFVEQTFVEDPVDRILEEEASQPSQPSIATRDVWTNVYPEAITPMYHGSTQIPCDPTHECFVSTATAVTQVTEELKDMSTDTKEIQANKNLSFNLFSASITSEEELPLTPRSESVSVATQDCQMSTQTFEKSTNVDSADYLTASRCSDTRDTPSEPIILSEVRTDTCLLRNVEKPGKSVLSLDLIYASRNTDANGDEPDLTKTTACNQADSNQQMMIEGEVTSKTLTMKSDDMVAETIEDDVEMTDEGAVGDFNPVARKLAPVIYQDHAKLLNSFYGLLFTIVFLGLNLTYTC